MLFLYELTCDMSLICISTQKKMQFEKNELNNKFIVEIEYE